ncbi:signal-regulatory protein beta-1-like isoform X2 [Pogona vitticeps]
MAALSPFCGFSLPFEGLLLLLLLSGLLATPSPPSISGPTGRVESGAVVTFNCTSDGFSPRDITLTWMKDGRAIQPSQTKVLPEGESISYQVWSTVDVRLTKDDVKSQLVCRITHNTLPSPLEQSFSLGEVLRVPPSVRVETSPSSPVPLNGTVSFTCSVESFYPSDATLIWLENNTKSETATVEAVTQNWDGTSSLRNTLEVKATEERNLSVFTCLVAHNSQPPVNETVTLIIQPQAEGLSLIAGLWIGITVEKIITAVFLFYLFLRKEHAMAVASKAGSQEQESANRPT